jgi:hypothetical protein
MFHYTLSHASLKPSGLMLVVISVVGYGVGINVVGIGFVGVCLMGAGCVFVPTEFWDVCPRPRLACDKSCQQV